MPSYLRQSPNIGRIVDPTTQSGSFEYSFPIVLPPGRNGMTPSLSLTYSSQNPSDEDLFGYGWEISIPFIERLNKEGTQNLYTSNNFYSSISGEIVQFDGNEYAARIDDGSYLKYFFSDGRWEVQDKGGTEYIFGKSEMSRQSDPSVSNKTYKWMLEKMIDKNGNSITYSYVKDAGQIYPESISYTGNNGSEGIFKVEFSKSLRSTPSPTKMESGFSVKTKYNIDKIEVKISGNTVRKYDLTYGTGNNGSRQLLTGITEIASTEDGQSSITLPKNTFDYSNFNFGWKTDYKWGAPSVNFVDNNNDYGVSVADVNGDNLADIVQSFKNQYGGDEKAVYINNGNGWQSIASTTWNPPCAVVRLDYAGASFDLGGRLADLNGDLLPDFICNSVSYLNNGHGWSQNSDWTLPKPVIANGSDSGLRFADVNGDGLLDLIYAASGTARKVLINNGSGWAESSVWTVPVDFSYGSDTLPPRLLDVNNDGLVDILKGDLKTIYINNGSGWTASSEWTLPAGINAGGTDIRFGDFNGDGFQDIGVSRETRWDVWQPSSYVNMVYINNGSTGWALDSKYSVSIPFQVDGDEMGTRVQDVNGDGLDDLVVKGNSVYAYPDRYYTLNKVDLNQGTKPDILTSITESSGKKISAEYKSATLYKKGDAFANSSLPYDFLTLARLKIFDGLNSTSTLTYEYQDGSLFFGNPKDRKFAGFGLISRTDDAGNVSKNYFHQGNSTNSSLGEFEDEETKIGNVFRTENYDDKNNLFSASIFKWSKLNRSPQSSFVNLSRVTTLQYDGNQSHRDKAEEYEYSNLTGDIAKKIEWGEVSADNSGNFTDIGQGKRMTEIAYASSTVNYLVQPQSQTVTNQDGDKISEKRFLYDNLPLGSISLGNPTGVESWISEDRYSKNQKLYNSLGLVTEDIDPRGKSTTYSYDDYFLYPQDITNALGQTTRTLYDLSSGKVKEVTDANRSTYETKYDAFDRPVKELEPDISEPLSLVVKSEYSYDDESMPRSVHKKSFLDSSLTTESYSYFDGLGRKVEDRASTEDPNVYATRDYSYDKLGLLKSESLPYLSNGSAFTAASAPASPSLLTNYSYDPLQRIASVSNSVGTTTNSYDNWKLTVTDPNGKVKSLINDAYGRLSRVDEKNAADTYSTSYEHNSNNNLTKITDAESNVRHFTYDGVGRRLTAEDLHQVGDTSFGTWSYVYDDSGNLTAQTDPKSQTVNFTYDDLNRALSEDYAGTPGQDVAYEYDLCEMGFGRLCSASSTDAVTSYEYNERGLIKKEIKNIASSYFITQNDYDRQGNPTRIVYPDGSEVFYSYNSAGLAEKVEQKESGGNWKEIISDFDYNPAGKVTYKLFGNGVASSYTFDQDKLFRLINIRTALPVQNPLTSFIQRSNLADLYNVKNGPNSYNKFALNDLVENDATIPVDIPALNQEEIPAQLDVEKIENSIVPDINATPETATTTENNKVKLAPDSDQLKIKAPKDKILGKRVYGTGEIKYSYKTDKKVDDINPSQGTQNEAKKQGLKLGKEMVSQRTSHSRTFETDQPDTFIAEITSGDPQYFKDEHGEWWQVDYGTTTKESYELQIAENHGPLKKVLGILFNKALAASNKIFSPDTDIETTSVDGAVWTFSPSNDVRWETLHDATEGYGANDSTDRAGVQVFKRVSDNFYRVIARTFFYFDTSSLGSSAVVNSASLDLYVQNYKTDEHNDGKDYVGIYQGNLASNTAITTADYDQCGSLNSPTIGSQKNDITDITTSAYNGWELNSDGKSWIDTQGITKLCLREGHDAENIEVNSSASGNYVEFGMAESDGTDYDPKLVVVYKYLPNIPSSLLTEGQVDPEEVENPNPNFSAVFHDPDAEDSAAHYKIQVSASANDWGNPFWDSGKLALSSSSPVNERSAEIAYGGVPLTPDITYYWRIKFWDQDGNEGPWSAETGSFSVGGEYTGNGRIQDIYYTYDPVGNITRIDDYSDTDAAKVVEYQYDDLYRLISASTTSARSHPYSETYSYSPIGNILTMTKDGEVIQYDYSGNDFANPHAATSIGGQSLTYDANGNDLSYGNKSYEWDYKNRLVESSEANGEVSYKYDQSGQRVLKRSSSGVTVYPNNYYSLNGASTTKSVYAGGEIVATIDADNASTTTKYIHADHLSSTNTITNENGNLLSTLDYFPFGSERIASHIASSQRTFIGQYHDDESDLSYLNARYYDSSRGQFLSEDPMFWQLSSDLLIDPQQQNSYGYGRDNPVVNKDPNGQSIGTYLEGMVSPFVYAYQHPIQTAAITGAVIGVAFVAPVAVAVTGAYLGGYAIGTSLYNAATAPTSDSRDYYLGQGTTFTVLTGAGIKEAGTLRDSALCVRGGVCTAESFEKGNGAALADGKLTDISVNSASLLSARQLSKGIPNNKIGVTTVGQVRQAGGNVVPTPSLSNLNHATLSGITPQQASSLMTVLQNLSKLLSKLKK